MKTLILSTLAAALLMGSVSSFAQAPSPHAKAPSDATGSGKDTGMNIQSGQSGNGGGVGTVASPAATSAAAGKTGASKPKSAKRSRKRRASGTSASR